MNRNKSKYFNTAVKMDEALITLLKKKDFSYVTVKEICDVAGVNRSTFYLHYENISDLLQETAKYIFDKHLSYYSVDYKGITEQFRNCEKKELIFVTTEYLLPYLSFVKENQRVFRVAIKQFNTFNLDHVYGRMFQHIFDPILARFDVPLEKRKYVAKFYLTGVYAIVMEWLDSDCSADMNVIAELIYDCVVGEGKFDL